MIFIAGWCYLIIMLCFHICCLRFNPVCASSLNNIHRQFHTLLCHTHTRETHRLTVCTQWHSGSSRQCPLATRRVIWKWAGVEACCLRLPVFGGGSLRMSADTLRATARPDTEECFWFVVVTLENEIRLFYCFCFNVMKLSDLYKILLCHTITDDIREC